jgi:hypothetical protein
MADLWDMTPYSLVIGYLRFIATLTRISTHTVHSNILYLSCSVIISRSSFINAIFFLSLLPPSSRWFTSVSSSLSFYAVGTWATQGLGYEPDDWQNEVTYRSRDRDFLTNMVCWDVPSCSLVWLRPIGTCYLHFHGTQRISNSQAFHFAIASSSSLGPS